MDGSTVVADPGATSPRRDPRLTILYDERCAFCLRCRDWLSTQPCLVEVELLPAGSDEALRRFGEVPWRGSELVVASEEGEVWVGPPAFLMCLWATLRYRHWAYLLSRPGWSRYAERFFVMVSKHRATWGSWIGRKREDDDCSWCDDVRMRWDV